MRSFLLAFILLCCSFSVAQSSKEHQAVEQSIQRFFNAFHQGDTAALRTLMHPQLLLQSISAAPDAKLTTENPQALLTAIAQRPEKPVWREELISISININGNHAQVWTPYRFWLDDQLSHCGANHFSLIKQHGKWSIIYLIDNRKREPCK
ncbi:MAG: nuclear transport factor 2 family protein [Flavobacteriaceae bacterium]|nr:nuclear transport factor 2 family protein [Flavobacteriaceae bacterium]